MRITALPDTGRPSSSRWRPRKLTTAAAKASPRVSNRSVASSILAAWAGLSHEPKASTRDDSGESATRAKSPSIVGSASRRSQEMRICGSLRNISAARSSLALVRASSVSSSMNAARPDPAANEMKNGGDRRQQHQRQDDEPDDIGLDRRHVERQPRRRLQGLGEVLRASAARPRAGKAPSLRPPWRRPPGRAFASVRRFRSASPR